MFRSVTWMLTILLVMQHCSQLRSLFLVWNRKILSSCSLVENFNFLYRCYRYYSPCGANLLLKFTQGHTVQYAQSHTDRPSSLGSRRNWGHQREVLGNQLGLLQNFFFPSRSCPPLMNIHAAHPERPLIWRCPDGKTTKLFSFTFRKLARS